MLTRPATPVGVPLAGITKIAHDRNTPQPDLLPRPARGPSGQPDSGAASAPGPAPTLLSWLAMLRHSLLLAALTFFPVFAADQAATIGATSADAARLARIAPRMQAFADQGAIAGAVTLLMHNGQVVHHEAVGMADIEARKAMAKDSIFQIMSMTKPTVATCIMMLVEEGRIALTDPVEKHLPEFRGQLLIAAKGADGSVTLKKPARAITVRDLLTHTSGMAGNPPEGLKELYQKMDRPLREAVLVYAQTPLMFEPGTQWSYSNMGIATLGRIIEVASGQAFEQFLSSRLLTPLGMKDSFIFPPEDKKARIAALYDRRDGKLVKADGTKLGGDAMYYRKGAVYSAPEFGLYSTASDLAAFYEMTRTGGVVPNWVKGAGATPGKRLLSPASVAVMTKLHTGDIKAGHNPGTGFGLAWEVVKTEQGELNLWSIGSYGHGGAFGTHGWVDPAKSLVGVFLIQGGDATTVKYAFLNLAGASIQ